MWIVGPDRQIRDNVGFYYDSSHYLKKIRPQKFLRLKIFSREKNNIFDPDKKWNGSAFFSWIKIQCILMRINDRGFAIMRLYRSRIRKNAEHRRSAYSQYSTY